MYPPRPAGVLTNGRVEFTGSAFAVDLTQSPTNSANANASVVNIFYWLNRMHDVLYELGFTETNGNFQYDNFGRGGETNDPVILHLQQTGAGGAGGDYPPEDGTPGYLHNSLNTAATPARDAGLDAAILLHEYTHLLTTRLVGGGVGIDLNYFSGALAEGWCDFYAIAMVAAAGDDLHGTYPVGAYASYHFFTNTYEQNFYFGIRRYPYSTDMTKCPVRFRDLTFYTPVGVDPYPGVPISPIFNPTNGPQHPLGAHPVGEVWCATLWDARANLIQKHGFTNGSWSALQLVTAGMMLGPDNPGFLQARDAILLADLYTNSSQNAFELWAAFAKRGMGYDAAGPPGTNYIDDANEVTESFSIPPLFTNSAAVYSSPALGTFGTIYFGSSNKVFALNSDGSTEWEFGGLTTNYAFNSSPALAPSGVLYVGCNDSNLYAVATSGAKLWSTNLGGAIFSSPALATDGTVYIGSGNGKLYAINPNGTFKWSSPTNSTGSNILSSPAVAFDGRIYFGSMTASNNFYAVNPTNGDVLSGWPVTVGGGVYSSPAIATDGSVFVGGLDGKLYGFTTNGSAKSGWPVTTGGTVYSSPAIGSNGVVYVGSSDDRLYAIAAGGTTNWSYPAGSDVNSSPALGRDGAVFVGSDDGNLHAIKPDGSVRCAYPTGSPVFSSPLIAADGRVYFGSLNGNLYMIPSTTSFSDCPWPMFRQNLRHTANAKTLYMRQQQVTTNATVVFAVCGPANAECDVEKTEDFSSWSFLSTLTLTNGVAAFEFSTTNSAQSFFRAKFH